MLKAFATTTLLMVPYTIDAVSIGCQSIKDKGEPLQLGSEDDYNLWLEEFRKRHELKIGKLRF